MTASKTTRSAQNDTDSAPAQQAVADMTRQQMASWADHTSALFHAADVMQQVQHQSAQRFALVHQQAAEKLRSVSSPAEMMAVQSGLMLSGLQETAHLFQELALAGMKLQVEMMGRLPAMQVPQANQASQAAQAAQAGTAAMTPLMQTWQAMFTGPLNGMGAASTH